MKMPITILTGFLTTLPVLADDLTPRQQELKKQIIQVAFKGTHFIKHIACLLRSTLACTSMRPALRLKYSSTKDTIFSHQRFTQL